MVDVARTDTVKIAKDTLKGIGHEMKEENQEEDYENFDTSRQLLLSNSFPRGIPLEEKKRRTF